MQILYVFLLSFLSGFFISYFMFKCKKEQKTKEIVYNDIIKEKVVEQPAKIIYKDKEKYIKLECPKKDIYTNKETKLNIKNTYQNDYNRHKIYLITNPFDFKNTNNIVFGYGYFVHKNLSLDIQTSLKFDNVGIGFSLYF